MWSKNGLKIAFFDKSARQLITAQSPFAITDRKVRDIEEMSRTFYLAKAAETHQEEEKQIFLSLASEEEKHLRIMENIVEFVARPEPGYWLENAEWHHLEEY